MIELLDEFTHFAQVAFRALSKNVMQVVTYPANPSERVFILYLATSLLIATIVHWRGARRASAGNGTSGSLAEFLFPSSIWRTSSAWLDVRYFFFHQIFRVFFYGSLVAMASAWAYQTASALLGISPALESRLIVRAPWYVEVGYAFISIAVLDFVAFALHYCQHRFPILWEFHKVHHSATVMHPLTNYREHPVDNIFYAVGLGISMGIVVATTFGLLGYVPAQPTVLGVGVFAFAFNGLGYNLRHSHIWLRWPGPFVYLFGSPAHHQVHHSYHPEHINKNFAFMFPVWDVVFRTFHVPQTNADVKFGVSENAKEEFTSCVELYWVPFRNAFVTLRQRVRKSPRHNVSSRPAVAPDNPC